MIKRILEWLIQGLTSMGPLDDVELSMYLRSETARRPVRDEVREITDDVRRWVA
jgi:hypothetical protein